jgi:hypothetical protein
MMPHAAENRRHDPVHNLPFMHVKDVKSWHFTYMDSAKMDHSLNSWKEKMDGTLCPVKFVRDALGGGPRTA